ncbi:MAG: DUF1460 domain-containing protein, partial [Prevotella sp.]|nr:DUF1460 domain-containing protein [Prevotella sp.]
MNKYIIICIMCFVCFPMMQAQNIQYTKSDSVKVESFLAEAYKQDFTTNWVLYFSSKLMGIPYVAKTLEGNDTEKLIINLRQLDCTTFVENVMALSICAQRRLYTFNDFCRYLKLLRYKNGMISYPTRLHYFTQWIADNTELGFVKEIQSPDSVFTRIQTLDINYMSTHSAQYPMLVRHPSWISEIEKCEKELQGKQFRYIPKEEINNSNAFRDAIKDGDIIAITTKKKGLDTSHIGFAVWHLDGLHLINASQIHKKVVDEPMTLYNY